MRRVAPLLVILCLAAALPAVAEEVPWLEGQTWEEIVALATEADKPILIDFYADWCGPCKMLDAQVYNQPEVVSGLAGLVTFKVDVDKPEYKELATAFRVQAMPTMLVCRPDGTEIDRFLGFRPADQFMTVVTDYLAGRNTIDDLASRLEQTPDDPELLFTVGERRSERGESDLARAHFERLLELDPDNAAGYAAKALPALGDMEAMSGNFAAAVPYLKRALDEFPESVDQRQTLHLLAWAQGRADDADGQIVSYRKLVALNPDDPNALNALAWSMAAQERDLDEATELALKAAELSDNAAGIVDTVAEVYYKRGLHDEALKWIEVALAKEPDSQGFQEQKAKFLAARDGG